MYTTEQDPGKQEPIKQPSIKAGFRLLGDVYKTEEKPYMIRWTLIRILGYEVRIHVFLDSDPSCLHDHPASFVSLIIAGWYKEITATSEKIVKAGTILYRPANWIHRVEVQGPCISINFVFPRTRNWGYWTQGGWLPWNKYKDGKHEC